MFYMWLAHLLKTVSLYQLDNPAKARFHIGRQSFYLPPCGGVEQIYDLLQLLMILHLCNVSNTNRHGKFVLIWCMPQGSEGMRPERRAEGGDSGEGKPYSEWKAAASNLRPPRIQKHDP